MAKVSDDFLDSIGVFVSFNWLFSLASLVESDL